MSGWGQNSGGWGNSSNRGGGRGAYRGGDSRGGQSNRGGGWGARRLPDGVHEQSYNPDIDPFIQKLPINRMEDGSVRVRMNNSQCHTVFGQAAMDDAPNSQRWRKNRIYQELVSMTQASIELLPKEHDKVARVVCVGKGNGDETAIENTLWLMNICVNAFVDQQGLQGSVAGFKFTTGLESVVASGCYGDPPGMKMQAPEMPQMQQPPMQQTPMQQPAINYEQGNMGGAFYGGAPPQQAGW